MVPACVTPQPVGAAQIDQTQCYCTTTTCGAGMLDAGAAVRAALDLSAVTVVEFYNASLDHYFITWVPAEIALLDTGATKGWTRTGKTFTVLQNAAGGTSPAPAEWQSELHEGRTPPSAGRDGAHPVLARPAGSSRRPSATSVRVN